MSKVFASTTTSVDGQLTGPDDGPGKGLGVRGKRLHYEVYGRPWSSDEGRPGEPGPVEQEWFDGVVSRMGAASAGRNLCEAAAIGAQEPEGVPCFIITHRTRISRRATTSCSRRSEGGDRADHAGGGGQGRHPRRRRQAASRGSTEDIELEHQGVRQSQCATIIDHALRRS